VAIDAQGVVRERARGFAFTTELFYDALADETLVLDAGTSAVTVICRDRDADGLCDLTTACTQSAGVSARLRVGPVRGTLPGTGRSLVTARLAFAGNVARAEPKQSGFTLRIVSTDGVVLDVTAPPGDAWTRTPTGGWSYQGSTGERVKVRIEKDEAIVRIRAPATVRDTATTEIIAAMGPLCGRGVQGCQLRSWPRRRPPTRFLLKCG
jgi:hypothetical protein